LRFSVTSALFLFSDFCRPFGLLTHRSGAFFGRAVTTTQRVSSIASVVNKKTLIYERLRLGEEHLSVKTFPFGVHLGIKCSRLNIFCKRPGFPLQSFHNLFVISFTSDLEIRLLQRSVRSENQILCFIFVH
jgi:hypothetical protein